MVIITPHLAINMRTFTQHTVLTSTLTSAKPVDVFIKQFYRKVPWVTLYQSCSNRYAPLKKMGARAKIRRKKTTFNDLFRKPVDGFCHSFTEMLSWVTLYDNGSNCLAPLNKMATRAKKKKKKNSFHPLLLLNQWMVFVAPALARCNIGVRLFVSPSVFRSTIYVDLSILVHSNDLFS